MSKDLTQLKEQAARAMIKGDWGAALAFLLQAHKLAPRDTHVALKIGDMHQRMGERKLAVEAYKRAATLFAAAGFLVKAISVNKLILSLDPTDKSVQSTLTDLYCRQRGEYGCDDADLPDHTSARPSPAAAPGPVIQPQAALVVPEVEPSVDGPSGAGEPEGEFPEIDLALVNSDKLPRTPLLSDLTKLELETVIDKMVVAFAAAGTLICREGETADSMYIIVHGLVRVSSRDLQGDPLWLTNLHEGEFFGEFGLFSDGKRHADVIAVEDTELLQIGRRQLEEIIQEHPRVQEVLLAFYKERVVDTLLAKSALTRSLSPEQRRGLLEHSALEIHEGGSMIIQEGDDGMHLFVIKSGEVEVFTGLGDKRIELAVLHPGDIFGEISVLTGTPTTANVVARDRVELVKFSRREVVEIAGQHPQLAHLLSETKEHRIHETVHRIQTEGFV
jgi:cAMP-dependent protein kinase regulator